MYGSIDLRYVPKEGTGAGNNWGVGYSQSDKYSDDLLDIITREAEDCDNFEVSFLHICKTRVSC